MLFATLITLILVPTSYMILDDIGRTMRGMFGRRDPAPEPPPAEALPERSVARVVEATS